MKLNPYPKYKDSGIEWLGEVPEHWEYKRLKNILTNKVSDGPHETPEFIDEGIPFLSADSIQDGQLVFDNCRYISSEDHERFKIKSTICLNDILMCKAASTGKIARVKTSMEFSVWSPLAIIKANNKIALSAYLEYVLKSSLAQSQIDVLCTSNTQFNISMDDIPKIVMPLPKLNEQKNIASFLDRETSRIDALIQKKERLIELLKEKRIALITQAVTKGLDPNVPMKDSGIEWLGEVPEGWDVIRTDSVTDYIRNQLNPEDIKSELVFHYSIPVVQETGTGQCEPTEDLGSAKQLITNIAILVSKLNPRKATICIAEPQNEVTICSSEFVAIKATKCNLKYLYYLVNSEKNRQRLDASVQSVTRSHQRVYPSDIYKFWTALPSSDEQEVIASFLDRETSRLDALTSKINDSITILREYRSSLINAAVTGKIDLREAL